MARTNPGLVKGVLDRDYDSRRAPNLTPYINAATLLTDRIAGAAAVEDVDAPPALLATIETWLGAHFYKCSDQAVASKTTGQASVTFQGRTDKGLEATKYGQTAKLLDPTNTLVSLEVGAEVGGWWIGSRPEDVPDYDQR